jgi:triosephosphate isomerase
MRTLIAGNWKMHGLQAQIGEIAAMAGAIRNAATARPSGVPNELDVLVCVPATLIARAAQAANGLIEIGAEDCSAQAAGAFTGDIDADMVRDAGATSVILGHSERRKLHHETDAMVAAKANAAWRSGLATIVCIGETQVQRRNGDALKVCGDQLAASLPDIPAGARTSVAYEPLWAIGSGTMPTRDQIVEVLAHIRASLEARFGNAARPIRILYGGSVKPGNARTILGMPEVGGVLIGGASLLASDFDAIVAAARERAPSAIA